MLECLSCSQSYKLTNVQLNYLGKLSGRKGSHIVDITVNDGFISEISSSRNESTQTEIKTFDLGKRMIFPTFVDIHTHLEKSNTLYRSPNNVGTWGQALVVSKDDIVNYSPDELYLRIGFTLQSAYHHGTCAIRSHIVSTSDTLYTCMVWDVLAKIKREWADKIDLQLVAFISPPSEFLPGGAAQSIMNMCGRYDAIIGTSFTSLISNDISVDGVEISPIARASLIHQAPIRSDTLDMEIKGLFEIAKKFDVDVDVHIDEHGDGLSDCLLKLANYTITFGYENRVVAGHCCSLSLAPTSLLQETIDAIVLSKIHVVSLPMCNMYLQDRKPQTNNTGCCTPQWRGIPPLHELKSAGVPIAFASDNVRDAFFPYGDMDMLEVLSQSFRIAQIDGVNAAEWISSITSIPGNIFAHAQRHRTNDLIRHGFIEVGKRADFVITSARNWNELLCRPQHDRLVVRNGKLLESKLPDYSELDVLLSLVPVAISGLSSREITDTSHPSSEPTNSCQNSDMALEEFASRLVPVIDISPLIVSSDLEEIQRVKDEIWKAVTTVGFFQVTGHGISEMVVEEAFNHSARLFSLPDSVKQANSYQSKLNCGYERFKQVRPVAMFPDQKESFQIIANHMEAFPILYHDDDDGGDCSGFRQFVRTFIACNHNLANIILESIVDRLGFLPGYFERAHESSSPGHQCTLRFIHYPAPSRTETLPTDPSSAAAKDAPEGIFRAAPHTDWGCITLLYQRVGQDGLEILVNSEDRSLWIPIKPKKNVLIVNVGDMLRRWSGDRLTSARHRVSQPDRRNNYGESSRYSIAYFMQANSETMIKASDDLDGPSLSAAEFIQGKVISNFQL